MSWILQWGKPCFGKKAFKSSPARPLAVELEKNARQPQSDAESAGMLQKAVDQFRSKDNEGNANSREGR